MTQRSALGILAAVLIASACGCLCPAGALDCDGRCVDISSTSTDCGACGRACLSDEVCSDSACVPAPGACRPSCSAGQRCVEGLCRCDEGTNCSGECVDPATDAANCGECGYACPAGASCSDSRCACPVGQPDVCGGACIDVLSSDANCGRCGQACPVGGSCVAGACTCPGAMGLACGGACVDAATNPMHCGTCDERCEIGCVDGACITLLDVSLGGSHSVALFSDGRYWSWGYNAYCQLGDGTCGSVRLRPTVAYPVDGMTHVSAGQGHTCALSGTTAYCWGWAEDGQLGHGVTAFAYSGAIRVPLSNVSRIAAGAFTTCALLGDGTAWCWGQGSRGVIDTESPSPVLVPTRWGTFDDVIEIENDDLVCARRAGGQVHCSDFVSGTGAWPREIPEWQGATALSVGDSHACVVVDGRVSCAGRNESGQLGNGGTTSDYRPSMALDLPEPIVDVGCASHASCARAASGRVYCWGSGGSLLTGPLGSRTTTRPVAIPSTTGSQALFCGQSSCCVWFGQRDLRCWGDNYNGQLGTGGRGDDADVPQPVVWVDP